MPPRKKILIIVTRAELGGAQNHIDSLVNRLHKDINFILCVGTEGSLLGTFNSLNLTTHIVPSLDKKQFLLSAISIAQIIRKEQPDLVHTHSAVASFVGRITAKLLKVKTLYTVHGWHFTPNSVPQRRLIGPILEFVAKPFTNHWITVSAYDKKIGLEKHVIANNRCSIIENGIPDIIAPFKNNQSNNALNVAFIGRATYQKNCLAAVEIIDKCEDQINLTIFSANGDHLPALRTSINNTKLKKRVTLIDDEHEAGEQLENFDLLLMTSRYEGMPLCGLEAMRVGIPIIASDVCGMNEIVHHNENGYLFNLLETDTAAKYLNRLLSDVALRHQLGQKGRELFEKNHLESMMISKTRDIYKALLND